jgi:hypothetical protein
MEQRLVLRLVAARLRQGLPPPGLFCDREQVRATGEIRWDTIGEREHQLPLAWAPVRSTQGARMPRSITLLSLAAASLEIARPACYTLANLSDRHQFTSGSCR